MDRFPEEIRHLIFEFDATKREALAMIVHQIKFSIVMMQFQIRAKHFVYCHGDRWFKVYLDGLSRTFYKESPLFYSQNRAWVNFKRKILSPLPRQEQIKLIIPKDYWF